MIGGNGIKVNKRRSELDIITDILVVSNVKVNKTKILYQCNLNYSLLQRYMSFLLKNDFLAEDIDEDKENMKVYTTTKKGNELLHNINNVSSVLVNK